LGLAHLERAAALCGEYDIPILSPLIFCSLGDARSRCGRAAEALPLLEKAVGLADARGTLWWQSRRTTCLGEGYLRAGRLEDAHATGERALALADAHGERASRAYALRLLGEVQASEQRLREALALSEQLGMAPLAGRCRVDLER
ncbi:MAG: adenylate cyclase, partial [Bradyrhizobium sp.]